MTRGLVRDAKTAAERTAAKQIKPILRASRWFTAARILDMGSILVAVPAFNEDGHISRVIEEVRAISALAESDILVIDDGSIDSTAEIALAMGAKVISHKSNKGLAQAFRTACWHALRNGYEYMLTVDADGQFPRASIEAVLSRGLQTAEFTTGSRFVDEKHKLKVPWVRRSGNVFLAKLLSFLSSRKLTDTSCGLRIYPVKDLDFLFQPRGFTYTQSSLLDIIFRGCATNEVPIEVRYFDDRRSHISGSILNYGVRAGSLIWTVSKLYFPLKVFLPLCMVSGVLGLGLSSIFITNFLITGQFSGFLFAGFLGGFFVALSLIFLAVALILTSLSELRLQIHEIKQRG